MIINLEPAMLSRRLYRELAIEILTFDKIKYRTLTNSNLRVRVRIYQGWQLKNPPKKHLLVGFIGFFKCNKTCLHSAKFKIAKRTCEIHQAHKETIHIMQDH